MHQNANPARDDKAAKNRRPSYPERHNSRSDTNASAGAVNAQSTYGICAQLHGHPMNTTVKHQAQQIHTAKLTINVREGVTTRLNKACALRSRTVSRLTRCCANSTMMQQCWLRRDKLDFGAARGL